MNLVTLLQEIRLHTKVFKVVSKTGENCKLFDKCITYSSRQLNVNRNLGFFSQKPTETYRQ